MGRWASVGAVLLVGCANNSIQLVERPSAHPEPKPLPGAVTLIVTAGSYELTTAAAQLVPHATRKLEALGHAVVPESDLAVELDLRASSGGNSARMCVQVVGRVIRGGQRFTSVELCRVACSYASNRIVGGDLGALITNVSVLFVDEKERAAGPSVDAIDSLLTELSRYARVRAPP